MKAEARPLRVPGAHGLSLHALEWGGGDEACLLLHGFGHESHVWEPLARELSRDQRVLALDWRGHGASARDPQRRYGSDALLADLEAVTAFLGLSELLLVGHSLGGEIALRFAASNPERVTQLVLADIGPEVRAAGAVRIGTDEREAERSYGSVEEYASVLAKRHPLAEPATVSRMAAHGVRRRDDGRFELARDPAFGASGALRERTLDGERYRDSAQWQALRELQCPTLIVRGVASSVLSRDVAERMREEVRAPVWLVTIPIAGHGVMIDQPDAFTRTVAPFLRSQPPGTP